MPTRNPKSKTKSKIILPKKTPQLLPLKKTDGDLSPVPPSLLAEISTPPENPPPQIPTTPETQPPPPSTAPEPETATESPELENDDHPQPEATNQTANLDNQTPKTVSPPTDSVKPEVWVADQSPTPPKEPEIEKEAKLDSLPPKKFPKLLFAVILLLAIATFFAILIATKVIRLQPEFLSPVPENPKVLSSQTEGDLKKKEVIGFLPYWNLKEEANFKYQLLSQVAFFALEIDANGNILKLKDDGNEEPGWTAYKSQAFGTVYRKAKDSGAKVILTIQAMDPEVINSIVNDPAKRAQTIKQTLEIIQQKNLDGLNIDFEYAGSPSSAAVKNFTLLLREFRQAFSETNPNLTLAVDVFADSADRIRIWDIEQISPIVDYIIIMAYDFHRPSSKIAAPVAPLRGAPQYWQYDISKTLVRFSRITPLEKIILGVPYYGYEWRTTTDERYSPTYPQTGALATYKRIQQLITDKKPVLDWDETSLSPRLFYQEKGNIYQAYYENEISLGLKYDLINESGLAGTAIWALGYDGDYPNLWNLLAEKFY